MVDPAEVEPVEAVLAAKCAGMGLGLARVTRVQESAGSLVLGAMQVELAIVGDAGGPITAGR